MHRKPSHFGSYDMAPSGSVGTGLASIGLIGGITGRSIRAAYRVPWFMMGSLGESRLVRQPSGETWSATEQRP